MIIHNNVKSNFLHT